MDRIRGLTAMTAFALLVVGCGQDALIVANRTTVGLAVGPGLTIPACDTVSVTITEFEDAREANYLAAFDGTPWPVPSGAVVWDNFAMLTNGEAGSLTLIVTGQAEPRLAVGIVAESDLPPCEGQPVHPTPEVVR